MYKRQVINLAGVSQMDTSGLTVLVMAHRTAALCGARLVLAEPTAPVRRLLAITRLDAVFEIHETEAAAVAAVRSDALIAS